MSIDFSVYRRPELAENISRVINLPRTILTIVRWGGLITLIAWVGLWYFFRELDTYWLVAVGIYATVAGMGIGLIWGCFAALNRSLSGIVELLDILLDLSEQVCVDVRKARKGNVSTRQVITGVYEEVLFPTLAKVVKDQIFLLGRVVVFMYERTLHRAVRQMIQLVPEKASEEASDSETVPEPEGDASEAADESGMRQRVASEMKRARDWVAKGGSVLRTVVIFPASIAAAVLTLVGLIPLVLAYSMLTG